MDQAPAPPPQFAAYPRPQIFGDPAKLRALADGYFGLNLIFLINVAFALGVQFGIGFANASNSSAGPIFAIVGLAMIGVVVDFLTYPLNKKIAYGVGWKPSSALVASVLMGLNSALFCGIIGFVVMQQIAFSEMKKYGLRGGFFGLRKRAVYAAIDGMQAAAAAGTGPVV